MHGRNFFVEYLRNPKLIGAVIPSSPALVKGMLREVPFQRLNTFVEWGAGQGQVTEAILQQFNRPSQRLLSFEVSDSFSPFLSSLNHPKLQVIWSGVEHTEHHLQSMNIGEVDAVISSLPFMGWSQSHVEHLLTIASRILSPQGVFVQIACYPRDYALLNRIFARVSLQYVLLHIPPSFVYTCFKGE